MVGDGHVGPGREEFALTAVDACPEFAVEIVSDDEADPN
jgi:hypothetical protein